MQELEDLAFLKNEIGGTIPDVLTTNMTSLRRIILQANQFSGTLPNDFLSTSPLEILVLGNNRLTGLLPKNLGNETTLTQLVLERNQFEGDLPDEWGNYTQLQTIALSSNALNGTIPESWYHNLVNLQRLYVNGNSELYGNISSSIGDLHSLTSLRLGNSSMGGPIPDQLYELINLQELNLQGASFGGTLSSQIFILKSSLQDLYLNNNMFTGSIPSALETLTSLSKCFCFLVFCSFLCFVCRRVVGGRLLFGRV